MFGVFRLKSNKVHIYCNYIYGLMVFWLLSGCYANSSLTQLTAKKSDDVVTAPVAQSHSGFISGSSTAHQITSGGYTNFGSIGSFTSEVVSKTARGYQVYSSVGGEIISKSVGSH